MFPVLASYPRYFSRYFIEMPQWNTRTQKRIADQGVSLLFLDIPSS